MKLSLFSAPMSLTSYFDIIDYCASRQIGGLELFPRLELTRPDPDMALRIADAAREKGLEITCFSVGIDLAARDGQDRVTQMKRWTDCAAAAGSPFLHHTLAFSLRHTYGPVTYGEICGRVLPAAREIFDYAADRGVQCLDEEQGIYCNGQARFAVFLDQLDRPAGVCLDLGNCLFADELPEKFAGPFLPLVRHVHMKDYQVRPAAMPHPGEGCYTTLGGDYLIEVPMGRGSVNFETVFAMLLRSGYDGWFSSEYGGPGDKKELELSLNNVRCYYENAKRLAGHTDAAIPLSVE